MGGVHVVGIKPYLPPPLLQQNLPHSDPCLEDLHAYSKANDPDTHEIVGVEAVGLIIFHR